MLLPEQMGWTFHRVCMKEASTWMLPLEMDKCCRKERNIRCSIYLFVSKTVSGQRLETFLYYEKSAASLAERFYQHGSTFLFYRIKFNYNYPVRIRLY